MKRLLAILIILLAAGTVPALATGANSRNDARLDPLFEQLKRAKDPAVAQILEAQIWHIWTWTQSEDANMLMRLGLGAMAREDFEAALLHFDELVEIAPDFAEGWNKRATVYFRQGRFAASVSDIERVLAIEPKHFGALSGLGIIYMELGEKRGALRAFEKAREIHPNLPNVDSVIRDLRRDVEGRGT